MISHRPSIVAANPILKFFKSDHLPDKLKEVSGRFEELAHNMALHLLPGEEKSVALRKLLEAKDAAVRAAL